jgi:outer membrane usher protein
MPLGFDPTSLNLSFTQLKTAEQESSRIVGISTSRPLGEHGNAFATACKQGRIPGPSLGVFSGFRDAMAITSPRPCGK